MTGLVVERSSVTAGLKSMLNSGAIPRPVGTPDRFEIGRAPLEIPKDDQNRLTIGYGIIYPLTSPLLWGSFEDPEDVLTSTYQITCHGRNDEHAESLMDATHAAVTLRAPNGQFQHAIPSGLSMLVIDRRTREVGTLEQGPGGLWQVANVYDFEVQAIG